MRISDWSSDVCSSDLEGLTEFGQRIAARVERRPEQGHARAADQPDIGILPEQGPVRIDDPVVRIIGADEPIDRSRLAFDVQFLREALEDRKSTRLNSSH